MGIFMGGFAMPYFELTYHWYGSLLQAEIHNIHHAMMYVSFAVFGATDIGERKEWLISGTSSVFLVVALSVEAALLLGHDPETQLEKRLHLFLVLSGLSVAFCV